jgi:hypothetical protein
MIDLQVPEIIVHRLVHLSINILKNSLNQRYKNSNDKSIQNEKFLSLVDLISIWTLIDELIEF